MILAERGRGFAWFGYLCTRLLTLFGCFEWPQELGPKIGCDIEVSDRSQLTRAVARVDGAFEPTGLEPRTLLLSPGRIDFSSISAISHTKSVCIRVMLRAHQQQLHYSRAVFLTPPRTRSTALKSWTPSPTLIITMRAFNIVSLL